MNLILFSPAELDARQRLILTDQRMRHIRDIHRASEGDSVRVGEMNGQMGSGTIVQLNDEHIVLTVELTKPPPAKLPLTVILALPRPKMIRRIFRSIAELGVAKLVVINSYKVEKSFWQSPVLNPEKIEQYLLAGLQQSKDTVLPEVSFKRLFKPFVEDELPELITGSTAMVAHPGIGEPCPYQFNQPATLAIGPEGGFTEYEVGKLVEAGFNGIHLGERILRVENALTTLIARLY